MRAPSSFTDLLASLFERAPAGEAARDARPIVDQCKNLMAAKGEASTLRLARAILATYRGLPEEARVGFFTYLTEELDLDPGRVQARAAAYARDPSPAALAALSRACEPPREALLSRLNQAEGATESLVAMRRDLLDLLPAHPQFARADLAFTRQFVSWFNRGFLVLRRIDWRSQAVILEKIIAYEAVHAINDWDDLRRRTQPPDRRCYAYFHPRMPDDPLIFVEVALTRGVPASIHEVLARDRAPLPAEEADTAVFYSISNCQRGLKGISFGNSLIKQVVADLSAEFPGLKTFITLSPIPKLAQWLEEEADAGEPGARALLRARAHGGAGALDAHGQTLRALAAGYVANVKRADGLPRDAVARFHLANGARVENVLAGADLSAKGVAQSLGAMVNYRYDLDQVERNAEAFAAAATVARSRAVQGLIKARPRAAPAAGQP